MLPYPWELGVITQQTSPLTQIHSFAHPSHLYISGMQQVMVFTRPTMCTAVVHRILIPLHELLPDASPGAHTIGTTKDPEQSPPTLSPGHSPKSPASTPSPDKAFFLFNQISFNLKK